MEAPMFVMLSDVGVVSFETPTELLSAFYADDGHYAQATMLFQDPNTGFWRFNTIARKGNWFEETPASFILPYGENEGNWMYGVDYNQCVCAIVINTNENGDIITICDIPDINGDDSFHVVRRYFDGQNDNREVVAETTSLSSAMNIAKSHRRVEGDNIFVSYLVVVDACVIAHIRN